MPNNSSRSSLASTRQFGDERGDSPEAGQHTVLRDPSKRPCALVASSAGASATLLARRTRRPPEVFGDPGMGHCDYVPTKDSGGRTTGL